TVALYSMTRDVKNPNRLFFILYRTSIGHAKIAEIDLTLPDNYQGALKEIVIKKNLLPQEEQLYKNALINMYYFLKAEYPELNLEEKIDMLAKELEHNFMELNFMPDVQNLLKELYEELVSLRNYL